MDASPGLRLNLATSWEQTDPSFRAAFVGLADGVVPEEMPGATCFYLVKFRGAQPVARAVCGSREDHATILGWFAAREQEAGTSLLREVCQGAHHLLHGDAHVIGPMNGNTWGRYRLALPGDGDEPSFPGEPTNPPEYPGYFLAAGFHVAAEYESRIVKDLSPRPGATALTRRLEREGIRFRPLDPSNGERELDALYALASAAFAENPYYLPISREEFGAIYRPLLARIDSGLVRLAHDGNGRLLGFALAYPDGGGSDARVVLKSVASAPDVRALGLGAALSDQVYARAKAHGYRAVIHALMHSQNPSAAISRRYGGRIFRRYALYEWTP